MAIGFLGLGAMGSALARRLLDHGHEVAGWNRAPGPAAALADAGARVCDTPGEALAQAVSFSMLADDDAALAVLDEDALASATGGIHVNMASISPRAAETLAARFAAVGVRYLAAPVLGRPAVAAAGGLNILVAGDDRTLDDARPYLDVLGARIWRFGDDPGTANAVKIAVNYDIIHAIHAIGESTALVEARGVDAAQFVELLTSTLFGGVVYSVYGGIIAREEYAPPGFDVALGYKDLRLGEQIAQEGGVYLPSLATLKAVFEAALADPDLAPLDWAAAAEVTRRGLLTPRRGTAADDEGERS